MCKHMYICCMYICEPLVTLQILKEQVIDLETLALIKETLLDTNSKLRTILNFKSGCTGRWSFSIKKQIKNSFKTPYKSRASKLDTALEFECL